MLFINLAIGFISLNRIECFEVFKVSSLNIQDQRFSLLTATKKHGERTLWFFWLLVFFLLLYGLYP